MEAVEFLKVMNRMCVRHPGCAQCPMFEAKHKACTNGCFAYVTDYPDKAVEIVQQWGEQHPIRTRQSEFLKQWPNAVLDKDGVLTFSPCKFDATRGAPCPKDIDCGKCRKEFWSQEVLDE